MSDMNGMPEWGKWGLLTMFTIVSSMLGYLSRTWNKGRTIVWARMIFGVITSLLMMIIIRFLCQALELDYSWTVTLVGLFSWLGTEVTINVLQRVICNKLGITNIFVENTGGVTNRGVYSVDELATGKSPDTSPDVAESSENVA